MIKGGGMTYGLRYPLARDRIWLFNLEPLIPLLHYLRYHSLLVDCSVFSSLPSGILFVVS